METISAAVSNATTLGDQLRAIPPPALRVIRPRPTQMARRACLSQRTRRCMVQKVVVWDISPTWTACRHWRSLHCSRPQVSHPPGPRIASHVTGDPA
jgi:hypothetical protein